MRNVTGLICVSSFLMLVGCDKNLDFIPPPDSTVVTFDVDIPDNIELGTAKVMYRSTECQARKPRSDGGSYFVPGYHFLEQPFPRKNKKGLYHLSMPLDGGGECKWTLSNVTVNIKYKLDAFTPRADDSAGTGFIVVFDNNPPQRYDGNITDKEGDFTIDVDLYPWLKESFITKNEKMLWLYGKDLYYNYKAIDTKKILIKPSIHSDLLTYSQGPKIKKEGGGNYSVIKYPDGSTDFQGDSSPDFERLQSIKNERKH